MKLVVVAAFIAVCGAAKLDRTYLPPSSANTAGGSPGSLQTPLTKSSEQGLDTPKLPTGSYNNNFEGVVVDAASPGTRASSGADLSGLGGPRPSYGSTDSKVGDAAFRGSAGFRNTPFVASQFDNHASFSSGQEAGQFPSYQAQGFENKSERPQAAKDRNSNILTYSNDVSSDNYSYGFETDNGIAVGENGVAANGIQAEGGYSYQGDDGQVYKVTYTADEGGYRPQGAHLPTPPPIPEEILKSLEQNAKEEAAGLVDDGSYDAQKYNKDGDYTHYNGGNIQYNGAQSSQFGKRPESDATASTLINQNRQVFGKPGFNHESNVHNQATFNTQTSKGNGRPGQFGPTNVHSSHSTFNDQQANGKPGSEQFGIIKSQDSHTTFYGHSNLGKENQFESGSSQIMGNDSQSGHFSQQNGHRDFPSGFNTIGQNAGSQFSSQAGQLNGFGSQSQFGSQFASKQTSASSQLGSQLPSSGAQIQQQGLNSQLDSKLKNAVFGQNTDSSTFNSQSVQSQFGSQTFKPQGSEAFDGASLQQQRPTNSGNQGQSQISQTGFSEGLNKPLPSDFNILPTPGQGQFSNFGSGSATKFNIQKPMIPSRLENKNEYTPPLSSNDRSQSDKPKPFSSFDSKLAYMTVSGSDTNFGQNTGNDGLIPNFVPLNKQKPGFASASASASFSQSQAALPLNHLNEQQESQFPSQTSAQLSSNSQNTGTFSTQSTPNFVTKPTSIPNTDLTTPLEPNETLVSSQNPQSSSQIKPSVGSFGSNPANNIQAQYSFEENAALEQQSSSQKKTPAVHPENNNSKLNAASSQLNFASVGKQPDDFKPQLSQNSFGQNQAPLIQGVDSSYYYNQRSNQHFDSAAVLPQSSRFPSSPSYQPNEVALPQNKQFFNTQSSIQGSNQFSGSLLPSSVAPTSATTFSQKQGTTSSTNFNGITQAAISPFPSVSPTPINKFSMSQNGQFGSNIIKQQSTFVLGNKGESFESQSNKQTFSQSTGQQSFPSRPVSQFIQKPIPFQTQTQFGKNENAPELSDGSAQQQNTITQQYEGTIYEYNKPAETLPAPSQADSSSSQTIQASAISETKPSFGQFQENQIPTQQNANPQLGPQGQNSFSFQTQQTGLNQGSKFGSQLNKPIGSASATAVRLGQKSQPGEGIQGSEQQKATESKFGGQSGKTISSSGLFSQTAPTLPISAPSQLNTQTAFGNGAVTQGTESTFGFKPQIGGQPQFSQTTQQYFGSSQTSLPVRGSQPQYSQTKPVENAASSQGSGYFYPQNPMPQFGNQNNQNRFSQSSEPGSNKFNQNSQSGYSQSTSSFNQQSQFGSAAKPQPSQSQAQFNQNTQVQNDQESDLTFSQTSGKPQYGQSFASSQAIASGQVTASAQASSLPQNQYEPLAQNKPLSDFGQNQPNIQDQSNLSNLQNNMNLGTDSAQEPSESSSKFGGQAIDRPFGVKTHGSPSNPLFSSACCQGSKSPTQTTDKASQGFASFQGSQSFNAQNFAGKGEQFAGPRQPPRFDDQTGYHY